MRYDDHLRKTMELREEVTRLRKHPIEQEDVILYLIEAADGFLLAAKLLLEIRTGDQAQAESGIAQPAQCARAGNPGDVGLNPTTVNSA